MQLNAFVKPKSSIDFMWRQQNRRGGQISGVFFTLAGKQFVANDLTPDQYAALTDNASVQIEALNGEKTGTEEPDEPETPPAPVAEPEPTPEPEPEKEESLAEKLRGTRHDA